MNLLELAENLETYDFQCALRAQNNDRSEMLHDLGLLRAAVAKGTLESAAAAEEAFADKWLRAALAAGQERPQPEPLVEAVIARAAEWSSTFFDDEVRKWLFTTREVNAREIIADLMLCVLEPPPDLAAARARIVAPPARDREEEIDANSFGQKRPVFSVLRTLEDCVGEGAQQPMGRLLWRLQLCVEQLRLAAREWVKVDDGLV